MSLDENNEYIEEYEGEVKVNIDQPTQGQVGEAAWMSALQGNAIFQARQVNEGAPGNIFNNIKESNFLLNPDLTKTFIDKWQYNFQTILGPTNIALVPSELTDWEKEDGFDLRPDDFGINRKVKNDIMTPEDVDKVSVLQSASVNAANVTFANIPIPTASAPVVSDFSTEASDPKNRIGNYYQEKGIFYKVTEWGPQQVSLSEVIHERVWADDNNGHAGWWTVREDGLLEWAGMTGVIRVVGDALLQIGPDGKDNYLRKAPTTDSADPKNRIGNYYQEEGKYYKVTALGPQEVGLNEVILKRVWADDNKGYAGWWTVREDGLIERAGVTGAIRNENNVFWQIGPDGTDNYKGDVKWRLVFSSEGNYGYVTLYDENKNVIMSCPATSGKIGETDRSKKNQGPIPFGSYTLDSKEISGGFVKAVERNVLLRADWGYYRVPLKPMEGTNMLTRNEVFLHGGYFQGSAGCVDIGINDMRLFPLLQQYDGLIEFDVIPGGNDILFPSDYSNV